MEDFRSKLDKYLNEYYKDSGFMGIVRVTSKSEIIYNSSVGYANIEANTPIDQNSVFNFYSMSKPLCAIGLMLLYEKGLIDLNNHPSVYVPEAKGFDANLNISHLLNHTSGIPDFEQEKAFADKYISGPNEKIREHLMLITEYPSHFKPGEGQMYANVNFVLCALIIENVSGMNYYDYMKKEVFTPLEMKTATFDVLYNNNEKRVLGYERLNGTVTDIESSKDWLYGAGDIVGTMDDAAALYRALKYKLLLKPETWQLVLTPSPMNSMGFGCTVCPWHSKMHIRHNGGHAGFRTLHIYLPEYDFDILLLSNSAYEDGRMKVANKIHDLYFGDNMKDETKIKMDSGYIKA